MVLTFSPLLRATFLALALSVVPAVPASAFDKSAWEQFTRETGTTFFRCRVPACAGSLVSYRKQVGNVIRSSAEFVRFRKERDAAISVIGVKATQIEIRTTKVGPYRHFQATNRLVDASGKAEFQVGGVLVGKSVSYSMGSTSPDRAAAEKNYRDLLALVRRLMDGPGIDI